MVKNGSLFVFYADDSKKLGTVYAKYWIAHEISYYALSENGIFKRFWIYRLWDIENRNIKKLLTQQKIQNPTILRIGISLKVAENPIIHIIF